MLRKLRLKLFRRRQLHQDLADEIAFHRDMAQSQGNSIPFGNVPFIQEQALDLWRFAWLENLWRDARMAARHLAGNPTLVVAALLSLGLGIGVNLTLFSLATEFLMSVPSITEPNRMVRIRLGGSSHIDYNVLNFIRDSGVFDRVTGMWEDGRLNWSDGTDTRQIFGVVAEKDFFQVMGVPVALGRGFRPDDPDAVVVLHHRFWRTRFNSDPAMLGRTITLEGKPHEVVGVLPESHRTLVGLGYSPDVYVPRYQKEGRTILYARLNPGHSLVTAYQAAEAVGTRLDAEIPHPHFKYRENITVEPLAGMPRLKNSFKSAAIFMAVLMVLAAMVLLIACVNVAGILLAQAAARQREMAIRVSLGAGRGRLLQQLLAESVLLAILGASAGFLMARVTAAMLADLSLPIPVPLRVIVNTDWRLVLYAAVLAAVTTIACGLLPALQCVRESMTWGMVRFNRQRLRRFLVGAQVAISMVILVAGFLFLRNSLKAGAVDPGFDLTQTVRVAVNLPTARYSDVNAVNAYADRAMEALMATPGAEVAAIVGNIPFTDGSTRGGEIIFADNGERVRSRINMNWISPGYFLTMGIPIAQGRTFLPRGQEQDVVIVNRSFVKKLLGNRTPLNTSFRWGDAASRPVRIIGVVEDTKCMMIGEVDEVQVYEPWNGLGDRKVDFVVRTQLPPTQMIEPLRRTIQALEPAAASDVEPMRSAIAFAFVPSQLGAGLMGGIGLVGLLLVVVGMYGTLAYTVSRRMAEFAVRLALGARRGDVLRNVLIDCLRLIGIGGAVGLAIAFFATKPLAVFLVPGLSPTDAMSFTLVPAAIVLLGVLAALPAALRAAAVDPASTLRVN